MKTNIVTIENSQGVRIPKILLEQSKLSSEVELEVKGESGFIVLDRIRAVDKVRLTKKLGEIDDETQLKVLEKLQEIFAP